LDSGTGKCRKKECHNPRIELSPELVEILGSKAEGLCEDHAVALLYPLDRDETTIATPRTGPAWDIEKAEAKSYGSDALPPDREATGKRELLALLSDARSVLVARGRIHDPRHWQIIDTALEITDSGKRPNGTKIARRLGLSPSTINRKLQFLYREAEMLEMLCRDDPRNEKADEAIASLSAKDKKALFDDLDELGRWEAEQVWFWRGRYLLAVWRMESEAPRRYRPAKFERERGKNFRRLLALRKQPRCAYCGCFLPASRTKPRRWCSDRCRKRAHRRRSAR
jgi:hypothetical protein